MILIVAIAAACFVVRNMDINGHPPNFQRKSNPLAGYIHEYAPLPQGPHSMSGVRLILALHNHQPVGNFDGVFADAYRDSYLPFLDVMADYPDLPFVLHTSGPLLEWLVENRPEYIGRLRAMVEAGRVEILGGAFYEPILTMIPRRDRIGQIRDYAAMLRETLGATVRGAWVAERVWEQPIASDLAEAGVEYVVLDDYHFHRAGLTDPELLGYYLTEDQGKLLKVFPSSERLRYLIPYLEPHESYVYLRRIAEDRPGSTVVFADDGEKFGVWPETNKHVYVNGWLRRFCDMLTASRDWLHPTTFARAVDSTLPLGKVYLPDSSYREMTEWALPSSRLVAFKHAYGRIDSHPEGEGLRPFVRGGGAWRNFKARYAETDEMYTRMLGISDRLDTLTQTGEADPDYLEIARRELYRGQCNCSYWHGAFGGLYLPHLRGAIYHHLIASHEALEAAEGIDGPRVALDVADYNLDARQEVKLENDRLIAYVRPAQGGHVYELDVRHCRTNVLATLDRRPEAYHGTIVAAASGGHSELAMKHEGLDGRIVYDRQPRKALVDHVYPLDVTLADLIACRDIERGDFATGTYLSRAVRNSGTVSLVMERPGWADGHAIQVRKTIRIDEGSSTLDVHYVLDELPVGVPIRFSVEINLAGMAGHADDRTYSDPDGHRLGMLDAQLDLQWTTGIRLTDEWLDLGIGLEWSVAGGLWCLPIETVSQSESGYEGVYQSSAVIPHWVITADESRRWEVQIRWTLDRARRMEPLRESTLEPARSLA